MNLRTEVTHQQKKKKNSHRKLVPHIAPSHAGLSCGLCGDHHISPTGSQFTQTPGKMMHLGGVRQRRTHWRTEVLLRKVYRERFESNSWSWYSAGVFGLEVKVWEHQVRISLSSFIVLCRRLWLSDWTPATAAGLEVRILWTHRRPHFLFVLTSRLLLCVCVWCQGYVMDRLNVSGMKRSVMAGWDSVRSDLCCIVIKRQVFKYSVLSVPRNTYTVWIRNLSVQRKLVNNGNLDFSIFSMSLLTEVVSWAWHC